MSTTDLAGRTAVITGAASGMGEAIAISLAESGAKVALLSRRKDRLDALAELIAGKGGQALAIPTDVTDSAAVESAAEQIATHWGNVDIVVNAAGVMLAAPIAEGRLQDWDRMVATNLNGTLHTIRSFTASLLAAADERGGADVVNVSSIGAHLTFPNYAVYGATKAAVTHLSNSLRSEFGPRDVRITNIEPGLTDTELGTHLAPERQVELGYMFDAIPALTAADIADLVDYAVSRPRHVNLRQLVVLPTRQA